MNTKIIRYIGMGLLGAVYAHNHPLESKTDVLWLLAYIIGVTFYVNSQN